MVESRRGVAASRYVCMRRTKRKEGGRGREGFRNDMTDGCTHRRTFGINILPPMPMSCPSFPSLPVPLEPHLPLSRTRTATATLPEKNSGNGEKVRGYHDTVACAIYISMIHEEKLHTAYGMASGAWTTRHPHRPQGADAKGGSHNAFILLFIHIKVFISPDGFLGLMVCDRVDDGTDKQVNNE